MSSNRDRVYAVTGGASGIGRATVERLVADGASVVAVDLSADALAWTSAVDRVVAVAGDVTLEETNEEMVAAAEEHFGALHGVFLNAGIPGFGLVDRLPMSVFDKVIEVNVRAVALGMRAALPALRKVSGGAIVVTGSTSGLAADPGGWTYNASKAAVINMAKSIALDGRKYDIACGQIDIGNAVSDMTQRMDSCVAQADGSMKVEPRMEVRHVADAVLYMAGLPLDANVQFVTVMATKMPFIGRG